MSLLNAWVTPIEALVAVDTDGVNQSGKRYPVSKLLTIPHLNAVLACRGQAAFLVFLHARCVSAGFDSFDELNKALPELIAEAERAIPAEHVVEGFGLAGGYELFVTGWSDEASRILGHMFVKRDGMEAEDGLADFFISPAHGLDAIEKRPENVDQIALAQVRWMRETFGAMCGGKLLLCYVTRKGIAMSHKLQFPKEGS